MNSRKNVHWGVGFKGWFFTWIMWVMTACGAYGGYATSTVSRTLPTVAIPVSNPMNCLEVHVSDEDFDPDLPPSATIVNCSIEGLVDDAMKVGLLGTTPLREIGYEDCVPTEFAVDITSNMTSRGVTRFALYDKTNPSSNNMVSLSGYGELTIRMPDVYVPDLSDKNSGDEGLEEGYTVPGDGTEQEPVLPTPGRPMRRCPEGDDIWQSSEQPLGCKDCGIRGCPKVWVDEANLNVKVRDVPVWVETAVGEPLELRMRFSNYARWNRGTNTPRPFVTQWSCQWQSQVSVESGNTNRVWVWLPSGSEILFTNTVSGGTNFYPPGSVGGKLVKVATNRFEYREEDGAIRKYGSFPWNGPQEYLLTEVADEWGNTVAVTYLSNRLHRVTQTSPNSGKYLEFEYVGANKLASSVSSVGRNGSRRTAHFYNSHASWPWLPMHGLTTIIDMGGVVSEYTYLNSLVLMRGVPGYVPTGDYGYLDSFYITKAGDYYIGYSSNPSEWAGTNAFWIDVTSGAMGVKYQWMQCNPNPTNYMPAHVVRTELFSVEDGPQESLVENIILTNSPPSGRNWVVASRTNQAAPNSLQRYEINSTNGYLRNYMDRAGRIWTYQYDTSRRITQKIAPTGGPGNIAWTYIYQGTGRNLAYVQYPDGSIPRRFTFVSGKHAVASVSNATGQVTNYKYNNMGLITNANDGRMNQSFAYDNEGFLVEKWRNGVLLEEYGYDDFGNHVWTRDAAGLETSLTLDGLGHVIRKEINSTNSYRYYEWAPWGTNNYEEWEYGCRFPTKYVDRKHVSQSMEYSSSGILVLRQYFWESFSKKLGIHDKPLEIVGDGAPVVRQTSVRQYDDQGYLTNVVGEVWAADDIREGSYHVDALGRTTQYVTRAGASWQARYDPVGNRTFVQVIPSSGAVGGQDQAILVESNRYNVNGQLVWTREVDGLEVSNRYNSVGWLTNQVYPDGTVMRWSYTPWGEVASMTDRDGHIVSNRYDAAGRLVEQIDARSNSTFYSYDNADRLVAVTNALGRDWQFQYDVEGNIVEIQYPDGSLDAYSYYAGQLMKIVRNAGSPEAYAVSVDRDPFDRVTAFFVGEPEWPPTPTWEISYGTLGLPATITNAVGETIAHAWDNRGRLFSRWWPDLSSETYQYDWSGATNYIDRFGVSMQMQPDRLGRLLRLIDGNSNVLRRTYATNSLWRLAEIIDARSNKTSWAYDRYGNPTIKTYADNSSESIQYNRQNQPVRRVMPGGSVCSNAYDSNGNLILVQRGQESAVEFAYDALNQCTQMIDGVGTTRWTFDVQGRVESEANPWGLPVDLRYDGAGRTTQLVFGAYSAGYVNESHGRISSVSAPEGVYAFEYYCHSPRLKKIDGPNGIWETRQYGSPLTNQIFSNAVSQLARLSYARGPAERLDWQEHFSGVATNGDRGLGYAYDRANQLTNLTAVPGTRSETFTYDPAGNLLQRSWLGIARFSVCDNLNRLANQTSTGQVATILGGVRGGAANLPRSVVVNNNAAILSGCEYALTNLAVAAGTTTPVEVVYHAFYTNGIPLTAQTDTMIDLGPVAFTHDADGNLASDGRTTYQYDAASRLTNVVDVATGESKLAIRYDGLGRRIEVRRQNGQVERYVYMPGTFLVLAVLDGTNGVKEIYTRGPDLVGTLDGAGGIGGLLAVTSGAGTHYLHADGMGNVVLATDAAGNNVAEYEYTPFGEEIARSGSFDSRFRFSSKERDPETGFYDFGYRVYAPFLGRWLSRDPLGEFADPLHNLYRFVGNNPLNNVDPLGLQMVGWDDEIEKIFQQPSRSALFDENAGNKQLREAGGAAVDSFLVGASFIPVGGAVGLSDDAVRASRGWLNTWRAARVAGEYSDDAARAAGKFVGRSSKCAAKTTAVGELRAQGLKDAHHVIQDAAVRDLPRYNTQLAPGVQLPGPSTAAGTPHSLATQVQRQAGGGTYGAERRIGYKALRRAGTAEDDARAIIEETDAYFENLGVTRTTPSRTPGNR